MKRRYITKLKSQQIPQQVVFAAIGTVHSPYPHKKGGMLKQFHCGVATYVRLERGQHASESSITYDNPQAFWDWLIPLARKGKTLWVFSDELATFLTCMEAWKLLEQGVLLLYDDRRCYDDFGNRRPDRKPWNGLFVDADPPNILSVRTISGGCLSFVDVRNYFAEGTLAISASHRIPRKLLPPDHASDAVWHSFLERDCEIIKSGIQSLLRWMAKHELGSFKLTAPSIAMTAFRTKFMRKSIRTERPTQVIQLERQAYYGGRNEVLHQGYYPHRVWELDVQSMYASCMQGNSFPVECVDNWTTTQCTISVLSDPGLFTCAECLLNTQSEPFPIRFRHCTLWCVGRFWTTLCGPELQRAWQAGLIERYGHWSQYRCARIFDDYVQFFWELRVKYKDTGNQLYADLCKLMLVGLFGKFGQRNPRWKVCTDPPQEWLWGTLTIQNYATKEIRRWRSIAGVIYEQLKPAEHDNAFTAISAWVTSYARERIRQLVKIAGSNNTLYVVTDALYCTETGRRHLLDAGEIQPNSLGKLSDKGSGTDNKFAAVHDYIIGTKRVYGGATIGHTVGPDGRIRERVKQTLADIVSEQPLSGIIEYDRVRSKTEAVTRGVATKSGWLLPIVAQLPADAHCIAMRQLNNLPEFDKQWLEQERVYQYWKDVQDVESGTLRHATLI